MPVCVADGSCVLVAQQATTAGLVIGAGMYAVARQWIVARLRTFYARLLSIIHFKK